MKDLSPLETLRHSAAHILATAVQRLYPEARFEDGPPTEQGFFYDIDLDHKFTAEDLEKIEKEMKKVVKENQRFERIETTRKEAKEYFSEKGQPYKLEIIDTIPEGEEITYYRNGDFLDLCEGPHVPYTSKVKAFKLLNVAGVYHKGDAKNKQLQRVYGTAFPTKQELADHLAALEEAKKRDHRRIGKEMRLFHIDEAVGQGLVLWTPRGGVIRQELQNFIAAHLQRQGYQQVFTPHIGKLDLYRTSGHFPYYQDSQFTPVVDREELRKLADEGCTCSELTNMLDEGKADGYLLKPMNCPMHIKIFASQPRSYRDLPVRLAEFGTVYRWEQSGELNGMTRVRGFTQDDAHLFVTEDQLGKEIQGCLGLVKIVFRTLGMEGFRVRVGLRDPDSTKYTGGGELWDKAEAALREAVKELGVPYQEEPGEAAFYGPKIDFVVKDVIGRDWQLGTVQVDYNLPERFGLSYIGRDNQQHRPVMIHRAPFGSMERFVGLLIEHFAGNFPTWLAPEQVRLLPITDDQNAFTQGVLDKLLAANVRASADFASDKLGAKIRRAETEKVPYTLVMGKKEVESGEVSARSRVNKGNEGNYTVDAFIDLLAEEIRERKLPVGDE